MIEFGHSVDRIRKEQKSLFNRLKSIEEDALFIDQVAALYPELPLAANERCGFGTLIQSNIRYIQYTSNQLMDMLAYGTLMYVVAIFIYWIHCYSSRLYYSRLYKTW
ncbi:unnamed protein product [Absidia cylindrospora]